MLNIPPTARSDYADLGWDDLQTFFEEMTARELNTDTVHEWLADWSRLSELVDEAYARLYVRTTQDTTDEAAEARFHTFLEQVFPKAQAADQALKQKLLDSGLEPDGFTIPLRNMRAEADLFRQDNLPLQTEERKVSSQLNRILGSQSVLWDGEERTLLQMENVLQNPDRAVRERAWRLISNRQLADRDAINALWVQYMDLRQRIARNAGYASYRDYRWAQLHRFDYTPADCETFASAIEEVVVPAAQRLYARRQQQMALDSLRPWDLVADPLGRTAL